VEVVKAGVPMSMLDKQGDLFVRMVDTGVAAAVLERGNLTREMASRGVLAPLIQAGLLDVALQHPELVVEMIEQGIFDAVVCSGAHSSLLTRVPRLGARWTAYHLKGHQTRLTFRAISYPTQLRMVSAADICSLVVFVTAVGARLVRPTRDGSETDREKPAYGDGGWPWQGLWRRW
jgi:hypothetical protein